MKKARTGNSSSGSSTSGSAGSTSVVLDVGCLEPFNLKSTVEKMEESFQFVHNGKGVSGNAQKRALFLHVAGMDVQEIYFTLAGENTSGFAATVEVLDDYFAPKRNIPFERHLFRQIAWKAEKPSISLCVGFINGQLVVSLVLARTITSMIKSLTSVIQTTCVESSWKRREHYHWIIC